MRGAVGFIGFFGFVLFSIWGIYSILKKDFKVLFQIAGMIISVIFFLTSVYIMKPLPDKDREIITEVNLNSTEETVVSPADVAPKGDEKTLIPQNLEQPEGEKGSVTHVVIKEGPAIIPETYNVNGKYGVGNGRMIDGKMTQIQGYDDLFVGYDYGFHLWHERKDSNGISLFEDAEWSQEGNVVSLSVVQTKYGQECQVKALKPGRGKIIAKYQGFEFYTYFEVSQKGIEVKPIIGGDYKDKGRVVITPQKDKYYEDDVITITVEALEGYDFNFSMRNMGRDYTYPIVGKARDFSRLEIYIDSSGMQFMDKNFEKAVRDKINKPSGLILKSEMRQITSLDCSGRGIKNFNGIEYAFKLKELNAEGNDLYELTSLRENLNLTSLNLNNSGLYALNGIHRLVNLRSLVLSNNKISSIDELKYLKGLEKLFLKGNSITDFSPVRGIYDKLVDKDFEI